MLVYLNCSHVDYSYVQLLLVWLNVEDTLVFAPENSCQKLKLAITVCGRVMIRKKIILEWQTFSGNIS